MATDATSAERERRPDTDSHPKSVDEEPPAPSAAGATGTSLGERKVQAAGASTTQVGAADDPAERAADDMADKVVRAIDSPRPPAAETAGSVERGVSPAVPSGAGGTMPDESLQRRADGGGTPETAATIQPSVDEQTNPAEAEVPGVLPGNSIRRQAGETAPGASGPVSADFQAYLDSSRGQGTALPETPRHQFENQFQRSFADVGIHDDSAADDAAKSINAVAFTSESDIYFRSGTYDPSSASGRRLLAHELTHVTQQRPGVNRKTACGVGEAVIRRIQPRRTALAPAAIPGNSAAGRMSPQPVLAPQRTAAKTNGHKAVASTDKPADGAITVIGPSSTVRGVLELQRLAGNRAIAARLYQTPTTVQRADEPSTLDEALRTGSSRALEPFRPFKGIDRTQLLSLVNIITTEAIVMWWQSSMLEEAWSSYGPKPDLVQSDFDMWKRCVDRGANPDNVQWIRDMRSQFSTDTRQEARFNLERNDQHIDDEAKRLGVGGDPAHPDKEADKAVTDLQEKAKQVKSGRDALEALKNVKVGYSGPPLPPHSDTSAQGAQSPIAGPDDAQAHQMQRGLSSFDPKMRPPYPSEEGDGLAKWETVAEVHKRLTDSVSDLVGSNPGLFALFSLDTESTRESPTLSKATDALAQQGQSPAEARAKLAAAFGEIHKNIAKTRDDIDDKRLGFEALLPVQERLYTKSPTYSKPFAKALAKNYVTDAGGDKAAGAALASLGAMALIIAVEIGTAGAATPVIVGLISLTASGATAVDSWRTYEALDTGSRTGIKPGESVVTPAQAEAAKIEALVDTAMALVDAFSVFKAGAALKVGTGMGRVTALEAKQALTSKLAKFADLPIADQPGFLAEAIEREGAQTVVQATGRSADELALILGRESAAGQKLAKLSGGLKANTVAELAHELPQLAEKTRAQAQALINDGIDAIQPGPTLASAGGWGAVEKAVANDAQVMNRLEVWRESLIGQAERSLVDVEGKAGADAARSFLGALAGIPDGAVEGVLGIVISVMGELATDAGAEAKTSAEGVYSGVIVDLDQCADGYARLHGKSATAQQFVQRQIILGSGSRPIDLSEKELDALTPDEFEDVMRAAFRSGHFESEGLPRMSVLELKTSGSGHGVDGVGLRRRGDLVDLYKLEFKQVTTGSIHVPSLGLTEAGTQGGRAWAESAVQKLLASDDPVAHETLDQLTRRLRRYFGNSISEDLLLDAFKSHLGNAPLIAVTRAHAPLDKLLPQLRGLARSLGRGNVKLIKVFGRK